MQTSATNEQVWSRPATVREFAHAQGFCDPGEATMYQHLSALLPGAVVLDLGVGAGRTVPLFSSLASRYVALDYVAEMVSACRRRFPQVDVRRGDARDLGRFADGSFDLVNFSFNGIDAVGHDDRRCVLSEVARVLKPGGHFWFSTLNMTGLGRRLRPWRPEWPTRGVGLTRAAWSTARMLSRIPRRVWNHMRLRSRFEHGPGWCTDTLSAHDHALLMHYTSLPRELNELVDAGFEPDPVVVDSSFGQPLRRDDDQRDVFWFQILARKLSPSAAPTA